MLKHKNIQSFLPVFNGFYNTIFEPCEDNEIEEGHGYDDYDFDYKDYRNRVSEACVDAIEKQLLTIGINGISITFQELISPKYYNYGNDSINVKYKLTSESITDINNYLLDNITKFSEYIKDNYTSRDGFISFWSNDYKEWISNHLNNKKDLSHTFGSILHFILSNECYDYYNLSEDVSYEGYINATLKENS